MKGLLLVGGYSSRMKQDKGFLEWQGRPLFMHGMEQLRRVCDEDVFVSIREEQADVMSAWLKGNTENIIKDRPPFVNMGPASGILTAQSQHPSSTWFILACDFPLCKEEAFEQIKSAFRPNLPFVSFVHSDGNPEPLFGIWSAQALYELQENALKYKKTGPCYTLKQLIKTKRADPEQCLISLKQEKWLFNTNTVEQWQEAEREVTAL